MWKPDSSPRSVPRPETLSAVPPARPSEERRVVAWVGKSVIFKGDLISSEDMSIDGRVEGTIEVRGHTLTIGPDADIHATIVAGTVNVLGTVTGKITADHKVDIHDSGSVEGDIVAPRLVMADGAMLRGRVDVRPAEKSRPRAAQ